MCLLASFLPVLLRYDRHTALYTFKVCRVTIQSFLNIFIYKLDLHELSLLDTAERTSIIDCSELDN